MSMRLLVTRPEGDGERTAVALRARGHDVILAPLLRMQAADFELADASYGAVVMTSANAPRALAGHRHLARLTTLPVFTVGRRTADAARAAGFAEVHSADGDQRDLAALIRAAHPDGQAQLLYLAAEDRAGDLAGHLLAAGFRVETVVAYRAMKAERFPSGVDRELAQSQLDGVLHFSRRTAEAYIDCASRAGLLTAALELAQFCLSQQVAEPIRAAGATAIRIAPRPDEVSLLELVDTEAAGG